MVEAAPASIGRYKVVRQLGRGMMGVVYEAEDPLLGRKVALKTIHLSFSVDAQEGREFEERFFVEARAAATLSHPGIVVVYDVGRDESSGRLFMALEFLQGRTLDAALASGTPMGWREAARLASRVAQALHHAHASGVVHRDIKPGNVMVLASGEPKVMDFGIAKMSTMEVTTGGKIFGTPSYMSPERAAGARMEPRSDVFSLGAVLYEMLTGRKAFAGPNIPAILARVANDDPPSPSQVVPGLPRDLNYVVARALAKRLEDRYPSALAMSDDLEDVLAGRPPRHRESWVAPPPSRGTLTSANAPPAARPAPTQHPAGDAEGTAAPGSASSLALPPGKRVSLAVLEGPRQGEIQVFEKPLALIGRAGGRANADLEIPDPEISRAHAVVECRGSRIVLRDLDSTNGTFVGGERVRELELENHGEFRVGRTRLMLIVTDLP